MDDLPDHFDLLVVGTGLTETILAAAASRIGKSVLQLDRNGYYGAEWASMSLLQWEEWVVEQQGLSDRPYHKSFSNVEIVTVFGEHKPALEQRSVEDLRKMSGKFCIDLCPRLVFSKGALVDLLIQSNICRYLEFKNCTRLLIHEQNSATEQWMQIPCTRDAVFNDRQLSLIQKRKFMKFIETCARITKSEDEIMKMSDVPFKSFLATCGLDERLCEIVNSVVVCGNGAASESMKFLERFIESSGRFGPTPFLWTLYGCGELPQAFARLSAVFGGVYCLNQEVLCIQPEEGKVKIKLHSKDVTCKFAAGSITSLPIDIVSTSSDILSSHAVCITNKSIKGGDEHEITSARISLNGSDVSLIEVGSGSQCTPTGHFLLYLSSLSKCPSAKEDLMPVVDVLFSGHVDRIDECPVLWSCFFNKSSPQIVTCNISNVFAFRSASIGVDYEVHINEAKALFQKLFPEETFLPRAPDAEDIVIDGQGEQTNTE